MATPAGPSIDRIAHDGTTGRTALWVLAVQCLLALSWTIYVLFLPTLLAAAGIERRWFVYVLVADQAIFAACDWLAGMQADRIATQRRRIGRAIQAITLLSSVAFVAMPWVAGGGHAIVLLATIFLWAATSSALRAPVFALLGRVREGATVRAGAVGVALVGISLAGAIGPYLGMLLKGVDARLPMAVSAVALALAGLWATRVEDRLPRVADVPPGATDATGLARRRAWSLAAVVLIAAFGTQVVTAIVAQPLLQRFVGGAAGPWVACFWGGFGVGLVPGSMIASSRRASGRALLDAALALLVACIVFAFGARSDTMALLVAALTIAGGAWGVFSTVLFASAVSLSSGRASTGGAGTASGLLFSAIALGSMLRLAFVAAGWQRDAATVWLPDLAWAIASALLLVSVRWWWRPAPVGR